MNIKPLTDKELLDLSVDGDQYGLYEYALGSAAAAEIRFLRGEVERLREELEKLK